jgi:tyrosyl-tRNA synthetase
MYGKVMAIPDALISKYFELCTFTPQEDVARIREKMTNGTVNPRDEKMRLARQIVAMYHGEGAANSAEQSFVETFQERRLPEDMPTAAVRKGATLREVLLEHHIVASHADFRRLIDEGAIRRDGEVKVTDPLMTINESMTLKIGKRRFLRIALAS